VKVFISSVKDKGGAPVCWRGKKKKKENTKTEKLGDKGGGGTYQLQIKILGFGI